MDRSQLPTRVIRMKPGDPWPDDEPAFDGLTTAQRMDLVWTLTQQAYAFAGEPIGESRLQRDVVRIERRAS